MLKRVLSIVALLAMPSLAAAETEPPATRHALRFFVSGHSLTDNPLPGDIARIAEGFGLKAEWNRQYMVGSSIRDRSRGRGGVTTGWAGYSQGDSRDGAQDEDLIAEFRQPRRVSGPYDALLITEQHGLVGSMVWNDTVRYLRHYQDRFVAGNPAAQTVLYASWLSLRSKAAPAPWIAYERAAAPVWHCIATRVNLSLAAEGRADRIRTLPAAAALASLVETAAAGPGLPGLPAASVEAAVSLLISDTVHPTRLATYYLALLSFAELYGHSPVGAWAPAEIGAEAARTLQSFAVDFLAEHRSSYKPLSLAECQDYLASEFNSRYWAYVRDTYWIDEVGRLKAYSKQARHTIEWRYRFSRRDARNPFHYDPATDASHWFPAP